MMTEEHYQKLLLKIKEVTDAVAAIDMGNSAVLAELEDININVQDAVSNTSTINTSILDKKSLVEEIVMTGQYRGKTARLFHIMGRRINFTSTTIYNDIGEGIGAASIALFPSLNTSEALELISTSAQDDSSPAGTGIQTVTINYINASNNIASINVELNGTTAVPAGFVANQILSMTTKAVGSLGVAVGNITIRKVTGAVVLSRITAGTTVSLDGIFMIPANYTGYLLDTESSCLGNEQDIRLRATMSSFSGEAVAHYQEIDNNYLGVGQTVTNEFFLKLPPLTKIKMSTFSTSTAGTTRVEVGFTVIIIAN